MLPGCRKRPRSKHNRVSRLQQWCAGLLRRRRRRGPETRPHQLSAATGYAKYLKSLKVTLLRMVDVKVSYLHVCACVACAGMRVGQNRKSQVTPAAQRLTADCTQGEGGGITNSQCSPSHYSKPRIAFYTHFSTGGIRREKAARPATATRNAEALTTQSPG